MPKQSGFGSIEGILVVVIIMIVGFTGYYVWRAKDNAGSTYDKITGSSGAAALKKPALQAAAAQTQSVYDAFIRQSGDSINQTSGKAWDIGFINAHKNWFTSDFLDKADKTADGANHYIMICYGQSATLDGFIASGQSIASGSAQVTVQEKQHGQPIDIKFPVTLKQSGGGWAIDRIDISGCP